MEVKTYNLENWENAEYTPSLKEENIYFLY